MFKWRKEIEKLENRIKSLEKLVEQLLEEKEKNNPPVMGGRK